MTTCLLWRDLKAEDVLALQGARDPAEARRQLVEILGFSDAEPKEAVLLEFFLNNLRFAFECKFTAEKTSAFFSVMRATHEEVVRGLLQLDQSLPYFKELLLLHAVQRPPYSIGVFSAKDVSLIVDFVNSTYFKHFKLFQYCFTQSHELVLTTHSNVAEVPPMGLLPLAEAIERAEPAVGDSQAPAAEAMAAPSAEAEEEELDTSLPPEVRAAINHKIQAEVRKMEAQMEAAFQQREARLLGKLAALENASPSKKK